MTDEETENTEAPPDIGEAIASPPTLPLGAVQIERGGTTEAAQWFIYYESRRAPRRLSIVGMLAPDEHRDAPLQALRIEHPGGRPATEIPTDGRTMLQPSGGAVPGFEVEPIILEEGDAIAMRVDASGLGGAPLPSDPSAVAGALRAYLQLGSILFITTDVPTTEADQ